MLPFSLHQCSLITYSLSTVTAKSRESSGEFHVSLLTEHSNQSIFVFEPLWKLRGNVHCSSYVYWKAHSQLIIIEQFSLSAFVLSPFLSVTDGSTSAWMLLFTSMLPKIHQYCSFELQWMTSLSETWVPYSYGKCVICPSVRLSVTFGYLIFWWVSYRVFNEQKLCLH